MKKILITIIAVLLVVVMSVTLFACKDKNNQNNNQQTTNDDNTGKKPTNGDKTPATTGKALTVEELGDREADVNLMLIYADQYLTNQAIESADNTAGLQTALQAQADLMKGDIKKVAAKLEADGSYSLTFTFENKDTYTYHAEGELVARAAEPGVYAGYEMGTGTAAFESSLAEVYNAFLRTVQKALDEGEAFGNDYKESAINGEKTRTGYTFGGSVEGAFTFNYGVGENQIGPMSYGLNVYGTLGYAAEDTEVAVEVIDEKEDEILVGLYYKDATLFLSLNFGEYEQKVYLDNADINAIVGAILGDVFAKECEHAYEDGYCTKCGKVQPEEAEGDPFYMHAPNYTKISAALTDLTNGNSMVGTIVKIVDPLLTSRSTAISGGTRYQYQINLDELFKKLLGNPVLGPIIAGAANPIIESIFPNLDLDSFQGIGGTLTLSFDVMGTKNATLGGVQVAYNVAQKDFRWNKNDDEKKLYGPVNAAITISDFAIDNEIGVEAAKVNKSKYTYFSPMNGEITADITYTDKVDAESELNGDYKLIARAEFNPFTLFAGDETRDGAAEIILNKASGDAFAHVYIHDFTCVDGAWDSTVTVYYDGTYYETKASQSDFFQKTFAEFILPLVARDTDSNLAPISDYVWELIDQFHKDYTADDLAEDVVDAKAEIDKLEVTKHAYNVTKDDKGNEVKEDLGVMSSSKWLDAIKANAKAAIDAAVAEVADTDEARKAAKKEVDKIVKEAKSDYNAQLKLEGKNDSLFEGFNLIALVSNAKDLLGLFITDGQPTDAKVFDYKLDLNDLQLHADLDYKVYNKVIKVLQAAIPKLEEFDRDAATVKVEMNTKGYEGKLWVNVEYKGYVVDVTIDIKDCIETVESEDGFSWKLASTCDMSADIAITTPETKYFYAVTAAFEDWDKDGGKITVIFKESDGARVTAARDEFVKMVITQDWNGEEYVGFDVELTLRSRNPETGALNEAHVYNISGKHEEGMYVLDIDECNITLGIGNFAGGIDKRNTLSFGIPAPWCNFSFRFGGEMSDAQFDVTNLKIAKWGTDDVEIEGIDTTGNAVVRNTVEDKAMDSALYGEVVDLCEGFFYDLK